MPGFAIHRLDDRDISPYGDVIRRSHQTVAADFRLTPDTSPTHPAFLRLEALRTLTEKAVCWGGIVGAESVAFMALEEAEAGLWYMEKLSVLPEHRHRGYGRRLLDHADRWVREAGGNAISIGIIEEHTVLKEWYRDHGYVPTGTKSFDHIPFTVGFMRKELVGTGG